MYILRQAQHDVVTLDWECLPGHWIGGDYVSRIVTALAYAHSTRPRKIEVATHYECTRQELAELFGDLMDECSRLERIATGHWITGFDLPVGNGARLRENLPPIAPVMASDTKSHLSRVSGRSRSQENLSASLGIKSPKIKVNLYEWENFNLKEPGFKDHGVGRVVGDVRQHQEMRKRLLELGWLGAPMVWYPGVNVTGYGRYHA